MPMSRRSIRLLLRTLAVATLVALPGLGAATTAQADYRAVLKDCTDGSLEGSYTQKELDEALRNMAAGEADYGDCPDVIAAAQASAGSSKGDGSSGGSGNATGGTGGGTTGGGSAAPAPTTTTPPSAIGQARAAAPEERAAAEKAATDVAQAATQRDEVALRNVRVPASTELGAAGAALPTPLVIALTASAAAACLAGGAAGLRRLRRRGR